MNSNKQSAVDFLEMVIAGDIDAAYEKHIDMTGRHHNVFTPAGMQALQNGMKEAAARFPHMQSTVQHVLGDGDLVAVHSSLVLEEGKPAMAVVHLFRFENGKIVELWDVGQTGSPDSINTDGAF
jgi:predicted SnoaL-like aldol condensation-catalyzing enzyme